MRLSFASGLFWTSVACCALAQLRILRSVRGVSRLPASTDPAMPRRRDGLEMLWAVVPAIALAVLLFFTWRAIERRTSHDVHATRTGAS